MSERLQGLIAGATRRPALTIAAIVTLAVAGAVLATSLRPSTGSDTFVSRSSATYRATDTDHRLFGSDAVVVLIREPLTDLVGTKELATVSFLEACLAGQYLVPDEQTGSFTPAPAGAHGPYGGWGSPCGQLMRHRPVQVVYGPGTFLNRAVAAVNLQIASIYSAAQQAIRSAGTAALRLALGQGLSRAAAERAAKSAETLENQQQTANLLQLYTESGIQGGLPRIDNELFISQVVFDQTRGVNQPKARFAYLFPTARSALIQVRLKSTLSDTQQAQAIHWIRQAVRMPQFQSIYGGTYTVSGAPVVLNDLAATLSGQIALLLACAVGVMALVLLVVFRSRLRLLPLVVALVASGITFGLLWLVGGTLTMASIAVLPILIGLAVDYAIQFQSRVEEALSERPGMAAALAHAARAGAPTIAVAALATATGFLVLLLSPVPMVRGFGLLLVVGVAVALLCALAGVAAAATLAQRGPGPLGPAWRGAADILRPALSGAGTILRDGVRSLRPRRRRSPLVLPAVRFSPERVLAIGAVLAVLGWVADTQTAVQTDITKLVPANLPALQDLHTLERVTGVSGQIDVLVHARNVATPQVVGWMLRLENQLQNHYHYLETQGCAPTKLCPALSLPDLFSSGSTGGTPTAPNQTAINSLLAAVPSYFSQAVLSPDHRYATLAFGIRLMPLAEQSEVIDYIRSHLHPPPGVSAEPTGLPVLAAEADSALASSPRRLLTLLAGLIAVGAVLLAVFRERRRALVPLVPIALATGWSALVVYIVGIPLNPMSATLGTLVIAISTEFSVLLAERYRQERRAGLSAADALTATRRSTGRATIASGITAIAGFGVLIASPITMLRDFGLVTVIDLSASLAGVLLVLPAVLALAEREDLGASLRGWRARVPALLPGAGRRAPAA